MWNARLDEAQAGVKIAGRNTKNLRYDKYMFFFSTKKTQRKF